MFISSRERTAAALMALGVVATMAVLLVAGLRVDWRAQRSATLVAIALQPPRAWPTPPPRPEPDPTPSASPSRPSPRAARDDPTPVVAPRLPPLIVPPPIVAATQAGTGNAARGGVGDAGDGTGGSGGTGGDGGGSGVATAARQVGGRLKFSDLPHDLLEPGKWAEVGVRYAVETDGRVRDCAIDRTSGVPALDAMACRLIVKRFRFRPARDVAGRPVRSTITETHSWFIRPDAA